MIYKENCGKKSKILRHCPGKGSCVMLKSLSYQIQLACMTLPNITEVPIAEETRDHSMIVMIGIIITMMGVNDTAVEGLIAFWDFLQCVKSPTMSTVNKTMRILRNLKCLKKRRRNYAPQINASFVKKSDMQRALALIGTK